jgi:hypothetical protein
MNTLQFLHEKVSKKLALIYDTVLRIINKGENFRKYNRRNSAKGAASTLLRLLLAPA